MFHEIQIFRADVKNNLIACKSSGGGCTICEKRNSL